MRCTTRGFSMLRQVDTSAFLTLKEGPRKAQMLGLLIQLRRAAPEIRRER